MFPSILFFLQCCHMNFSRQGNLQLLSPRILSPLTLGLGLTAELVLLSTSFPQTLPALFSTSCPKSGTQCLRSHPHTDPSSKAALKSSTYPMSDTIPSLEIVLTSHIYTPYCKT